MIVVELIRKASDYLGAKKCETPRLDAEILLSHTLQTDRLKLYLAHDRPISEGEQTAFREFIRRRSSGEPVAYIVGKKEFWSLSLSVGPGVLIPRPETETLVEAVLAAFPDRKRPYQIVDVGTGSGAVAIALAHEFKAARLFGTDTSEEALSYARTNLAQHGFSSRVTLERTSGLGVSHGADSLDAVVSNPPYIAKGDSALDENVLRYEPHEALFASGDGLDVIRDLVTESPRVLKSGGLLALEVGFGQAKQVVTLIESTARYQDVQIRPDLAQVPRVVLCRRA